MERELELNMSLSKSGIRFVFPCDSTSLGGIKIGELAAVAVWGTSNWNQLNPFFY